jgi:flavin-dependent dehydrogenase
MVIEHFDLIIAGAGPAVATCAMAFEKSGLRIVVIDRYNFPRNKICGAFVAAKGIREWVYVKPQLQDRLAKYPCKVINTKTHFYVNDLDPLDFNWVLKSYNIKRMDFDNELVEMMLEDLNLSFYPGLRIRKVSLKNDLV